MASGSAAMDGSMQFGMPRSLSASVEERSPVFGSRVVATAAAAAAAASAATAIDAAAVAELAASTAAAAAAAAAVHREESIYVRAP